MDNLTDETLSREVVRLMMEKLDADIAALWSFKPNWESTASWRDPNIIDGTCRVIPDDLPPPKSLTAGKIFWPGWERSQC